ncbi:YqeG family HAD IIIA-type phosphatase [Alkalinema sp. FACHB-956]|uniref:YqeG family HAD IIIA-type phosphatase n=1 Tax=Alkalinema sp. FACHB-956 TaxID=2692768 RepID=UPI0016827E38|nr:YqeG family HAD IIIA-type phosphatase [Alkalinema sp. FACHB-956]MBD2326849.1 YqeG family HAD IIIA-type phosphatase [Alkalinema sp. FACHB-956]
MSWGKLLQPDLLLSDTILSLSPDLLQARGLRGLVLDVDETLVPITMAQVSSELLPWVEAVKTVAPQIWLVSNNISETRIKRIAETLKVPYISGAAKPSRRKLRRAVEAIGLPPEQVGMVGDRLFTDVLAGNRLGMHTILVQPMVDPQEDRRYLIHSIEFFLSRALGATLVSHKP